MSIISIEERNKNHRITRMQLEINITTITKNILSIIIDLKIIIQFINHKDKFLMEGIGCQDPR